MNIYENHYWLLKNALEETDDPREKLQLVSVALRELRDRVIREGLDDETWFLKTMLPRFTSLHELYGEWQRILDGVPRGTERVVLAYYMRHLDAIDHFINTHYTFYQYFKSGQTDLDAIYFERTASTLGLPLADPAYSAPVSELFGRFMAYDILRERLQERVKGIFTGRRLQWTGSLVDLTELIYGLYYTGRLNNGRASLNDIRKLMEDIFQVELVRIHRAFYRMRERKKLGPTHFLDEMRQSILSAVENGLTYEPKNKYHL